MRNFLVVFVLLFCGAGSLYLLGAEKSPDAGAGVVGELGERAQAAVETATAVVSSQARDAGIPLGGGSGKPEEGPSYYQYVDDKGTVHFVRSLEQVPGQWRDKAGRLELEELARASSPPARARATRPGQDEPASTRSGREVVVYTTTWCGWCRKTVAYLDQKGVEYVNKDIEANDHNRDELMRKTGRTSIPVVEIDGEIIRGYDPNRMDALLRSS